MSERLWQEALSLLLPEALNQPLPEGEWPPRVAIVGVGHPLRGDDAAGLVMAEMLQRKLVSTASVLVVEGGSAPENCTGLLRRFDPELIILVDTAAMDLPPGAVRWLTWQDEATNKSLTSHALPLRVLVRYLAAELGCPITILGIQPAELSFDTPLSPPVREAVEMIAQELVDAFAIQEGAIRP
jgi:hydrogenase 3 maturation protease